MRTHKFLIVISGTSEYWSEYSYQGGDEWLKSLIVREDPEVRVIECHHENYEDNIVHFTTTCGDVVNPIRDVRGNYYVWDDIWTKLEVVNAFE